MYALSKFQEENPGLTIAANVFANIASLSPVYSGLRRSGRVALAARASHAVFRRHYSRRQIPGLAWQLAGRFTARLMQYE